MAKFPSSDEILDWIRANPDLATKRDIARAFGIKGADRILLKKILREFAAAGHVAKEKSRFRETGQLPGVTVCRVIGPDAQGDLLAAPAQWDDGDGPAPTIFVVPKKGDPSLGAGDRILAKLTREQGEGFEYTARLIRKIGSQSRSILGVFRKTSQGGRIVPIDKGADKEWQAPEGMTLGAKDGELVQAEQAGPKTRMGLPRARIVERLGDPSAPKSVSLIAIRQHGIPDDFPADVTQAAEAAQPVPIAGRTDLRHLPLITIDPSDARDHDDACCVIETEGGFTLWVAIADVAHYVRPGSPLDEEALLRGNSSYFPDRVVPMLPDALSGDLCSLHEGVDRACIAVEMQIDADGNKLGQTFHRAMMNSPAALSYEEAQTAIDGDPNDRTAPLLDPVLRPLFAAYEALKRAREARQPLDLDLPERKIVLDDDGHVTSVGFRDRLDAHRLIEEFMVLANVAAAETLIEKKAQPIFRVHEEPSPEKLEALRETVSAAGLKLAKGQVLKTRHLNQLLKSAQGMDEAELINISTLRSMTQAYYSPRNFGHFGLALQNYAHFTSPIRRYADLMIHRALIAAHGWEDVKLPPFEILEKISEDISNTERRSMVAERDTTDRYLAAYLSERLGDEMTGRVAGIAKFGIFVKLDETGADGLVPMRALGGEYFRHDRDANKLTGMDSGREITLGLRATVRLAEADGTTGGIILDLLELEGKQVSQKRTRRGGGKPSKKKRVTRKRR